MDRRNRSGQQRRGWLHRQWRRRRADEQLKIHTLPSLYTALLFAVNTNIDNRYNNLADFPKLTFKSQNVRSFNLSTINDTTEHKIQGITKGGADIIFLCDTRLNSINNTANVNNLKKRFFFLGYNFYHNSVGSNRGTAILISTKLDCKITRTLGDINGNFIV